MNTRIETIDTHTAGEPTRLITSGLDRSQFEGGSVADQRDAFAATHDWVRQLLLKEPRGHDDMFGAVRVPPEVEDADIGLFFMDSDGYLDMCGHGTIGVVTALIELGELEPHSPLRVETPAGIVTTRPVVDDGHVESVAVRNVRSFTYDETTVTVETDAGKQTLNIDVVYAGNFFAMVNGDDVGLSIDTIHATEFIDLGLRIRAAVNDSLNIVNPLTSESDAVSITEFYWSGRDADRNIVVFGDGSIDRSPCGTGTCAKMTLLHNQGKLDVGERYAHESIIGSRFTGRLCDVEGRDSVTVTVPEVTGTAHITGEHTFVRAPNDSLDGFSVARH